MKKVLFSLDVHDPQTRSYNMSCIKGKGTKPEEIVRKYLFSRGFRYIKNDPKLPGKPDVVLPKYKCVVFVNGCFWHHHEGCRYFKWPSNNADFWKEKITKNTERDKHNALLLQEAGWNVIVIWECELKRCKEETLLVLEERIKGNRSYCSNTKTTQNTKWLSTKLLHNE